MTRGIGDNSPPSAIEAFSAAIEDVRLEAGNWLDGSAIETQAQADAVGIIVSTAKKLGRDADLARKADKEPHLEAGRVVDAAWKPLLEQVEAITKAAQAPLTAYLNRLAEVQRQEAEAARQEAQRLQQAAIEAQRASAVAGNIEAVEAAEALQRDADTASKVAAKAEKAKPLVAGEGRSIGLRTAWVAVITDRRALLEHVMRHAPDALTEFLTEFARKTVAHGVCSLPGVDIKQDRKAA